MPDMFWNIAPNLWTGNQLRRPPRFYLLVWLVLLTLPGCAPTTEGRVGLSVTPDASGRYEQDEVPKATDHPSGTAEVGSDLTVPEAGSVVPSGSLNLSQLTPEGGSALGGESFQAPAPGIPNAAAKMVQLAKQDLGSRLNIDIDAIVLSRIDEVDWPDRNLGCPGSQTAPTAEAVPGFRIALVADGNSYAYHADRNEAFVLCVDGRAAPPLSVE